MIIYYFLIEYENKIIFFDLTSGDNHFSPQEEEIMKEVNYWIIEKI